jgi:hypothetical protein
VKIGPRRKRGPPHRRPKERKGSSFLIHHTSAPLLILHQHTLFHFDPHYCLYHPFIHSFIHLLTLFCLVVAHLSTRSTLVVYVTFHHLETKTIVCTLLATIYRQFTSHTTSSNLDPLLTSIQENSQSSENFPRYTRYTNLAIFPSSRSRKDLNTSTKCLTNTNTGAMRVEHGRGLTQQRLHRR